MRYVPSTKSARIWPGVIFRSAAVDTSTEHWENWVISVLPFFEQQALYDTFDLTRPDDSTWSR